jgi:acyl-CoA dehydrogenase
MADGAVFNPDLRSLAESFFRDHLADARAELDQTGSLPEEIWKHTRELGLTTAGIPAEVGGSGGDVADLLTVVMSAARVAVPLPVAENLLGAWLLSRAGQQVAMPLTSVVIPSPGDTLALVDGVLTGTGGQVPWGASAGMVTALVEDGAGVRHLVAFAPQVVTSDAGPDLAGQPTASVTVSARPDVCVLAPFHDDYQWLGALCRAAQIAGALESVARLTIRYAGQRVQFGKPIASFQAVQHHLVTVAQASEAAHMAVSRAARSLVLDSPRWTFDACAAKVVANQSARAAARAAHQVHGAMGMTAEYELHHLTRRLHLWRLQCGTERQLTRALGAVSRSAPSLMDLLADEDTLLEVAWPT